MAYSEATIRARIKTVMETVTDIGQVHDYERWADDWETLLARFKSVIDDSEQLRGWTISLARLAQEVATFGDTSYGETIAATYDYHVRGFMGVDDANASEKTFAALVVSVVEAMEDDATLAGWRIERDSPVVAVGDMAYKMFGGVLCHAVDMVVRLQEYV